MMNAHHRPSSRAPLLALAFVAAAAFGLPSSTHSEETEPKPALPRTSAELFQTTKIWTIHLQFTPDQWAAMEPKGGRNPFDPAAFGNGMFITPAVMRDGDRNADGRVSADEFAQLGEKWFAAWDADGDGSLESQPIRDGLKATLAPPGEQRRPAPGPGGFSLQGPEGQRNGLSAMMGIEFDYVHAALDFEGTHFADVAVRYKGNGTFAESRNSLKRSVKIDLNEFVKGQKIAGATTLNLHNNVTDAGSLNEPLAYEIYREAGVPAPRTAYARLFVTVPGKHERKYFGLYSLVENVDKNFVSDRTLPKTTAIFKPTSPNLFADLGDDWAKYKQTYDPKSEPTALQQRRMIEFCRLVTSGGDEAFAQQLGEFIDLDEFAEFLAVSVWIGDLDSILSTGQNFYMLLDPKTNRFQFVPWDKDHTFGSWIAGSVEEKQQHSIRQPWDGQKRFLERTFQVEAFRERYFAALTKLGDGPARPERLAERVGEIGQAIRPAVAEESPDKLAKFDAVLAGKPLPGGFGFGFGFGAANQTILQFVPARAASVKAQLAGESEGHVLGRSRPGGPGGPGGPPDFKPEMMIEPALVESLDLDKDKKLSRAEFVEGFGRWFAKWDAEKSGELSRDQIQKGLNLSLRGSFGFGPPPGGGRRAPNGAGPPGAPPTPSAPQPNDAGK